MGTSEAPAAALLRDEGAGFALPRDFGVKTHGHRVLPLQYYQYTTRRVRQGEGVAAALTFCLHTRGVALSRTRHGATSEGAQASSPGGPVQATPSGKHQLA